MKQLACLTALFGLTFLWSCEKAEFHLTPTDSSFQAGLRDEAQLCGTPIVVNLWAGQTIEAGTVLVGNDADNLYVTYALYDDFFADGWRLTETHLFVGPLADLPVNNGGNLVIGQFPYAKEGHEGTESQMYTYVLPLSDLTFEHDNCYTIVPHAALVREVDGTVLQQETAFGGTEFIKDKGRWWYRFEYCLQECETLLPACEGQLRTQTQGGWGSTPAGNNPGTYLHDHFATTFPTGLVIGCASEFTVTYATAQAITDYLPAGGPAAVLAADYTDPTGALNNVLVGQVTALTLSVNFDLTDPDFAPSDFNLINMVVADGPFAGWTIGEVLAEANAVLGGCSTDYTPAQINEVVSAINENYVDGTMDGHFLTCPE